MAKERCGLTGRDVSIRCAQGPVLVVYPEGVWYRYDSREDLQKIARSHLLDGEIVEALRLPDE